MASLHHNQPARVVVATAYSWAETEGEKQQAFADVEVNGQVFRRCDQNRIFRHGEIIMVPMEWFWKLFAELKPEVVGISWTGKTGRYHEGAKGQVITYSEELSPLGALIVDAVFDAAYIDSPERAVRLKAQAAIRLLQLYGLYEPVEDWEPRILFDVLPQAAPAPQFAWLADRPNTVVVDGFLQPGGCWLQLEQGYAYVLPITDANRTQQWMRIHIYGNPRGRMFTSSTVGPWSYPEFDAIDAFMAQHPMPAAAEPATVVNGPQISGSIQAGRSVNIATNMNVDNRDR